MRTIPDHYQVKFRVKGKRTWRYGIFSRWGPDFEELWKKGQAGIADAILPKSYLIKYDETEIVDIPHTPPDYDKETGTFIPTNEFTKYIDQEHEKAKIKALNSETLKNKMFKVGVADGYACYIVTKVNKKTVRVEWRGFAGGDRYTDQMMGWECTVDKSRVEQMVKREEGLKALFAKK